MPVRSLSLQVPHETEISSMVSDEHGDSHGALQQLQLYSFQICLPVARLEEGRVRKIKDFLAWNPRGLTACLLESCTGKGKGLSKTTMKKRAHQKRAKQLNPERL